MARLTFIFLLMAAPAQAHIGHLGELAAHDHWVAGAALGAAAVITVWGALKGKKEEAEADDDNDEMQEEES